ncbi:MAG: hypothetical protein EA426_07215 [Spirochaetaceae bacterium]|nr:MAG: hypothetical protein EA426_07215 [Spirochaetaceae bacterium]
MASVQILADFVAFSCRFDTKMQKSELGSGTRLLKFELLLRATAGGELIMLRGRSFGDFRS